MQVCACADCTDTEMLAVANLENPSGTSNGWVRVIREDEPADDFWHLEKMVPVVCGDDPTRKHFILVC